MLLTLLANDQFLIQVAQHRQKILEQLQKNIDHSKKLEDNGRIELVSTENTAFQALQAKHILGQILIQNGLLLKFEDLEKQTEFKDSLEKLFPSVNINETADNHLVIDYKSLKMILGDKDFLTAGPFSVTFNNGKGVSFCLESSDNADEFLRQTPDGKLYYSATYNPLIAPQKKGFHWEDTFVYFNAQGQIVKAKRAIFDTPYHNMIKTLLSETLPIDKDDTGNIITQGDAASLNKIIRYLTTEKFTFKTTTKEAFEELKTSAQYYNIEPLEAWFNILKPFENYPGYTFTVGRDLLSITGTFNIDTANALVEILKQLTSLKDLHIEELNEDVSNIIGNQVAQLRHIVNLSLKGSIGSKNLPRELCRNMADLKSLTLDLDGFSSESIIALLPQSIEKLVLLGGQRESYNSDLNFNKDFISTFNRKTLDFIHLKDLTLIGKIKVDQWDPNWDLRKLLQLKNLTINSGNLREILPNLKLDSLTIYNYNSELLKILPSNLIHLFINLWGMRTENLLELSKLSYLESLSLMGLKISSENELQKLIYFLKTLPKLKEFKAEMPHYDSVDLEPLWSFLKDRGINYSPPPSLS